MAEIGDSSIKISVQVFLCIPRTQGRYQHHPYIEYPNDFPNPIYSHYLLGLGHWDPLSTMAEFLISNPQSLIRSQLRRSTEEEKERRGGKARIRTNKEGVRDGEGVETHLWFGIGGRRRSRGAAASLAEILRRRLAGIRRRRSSSSGHGGLMRENDDDDDEGRREMVMVMTCSSLSLSLSCSSLSLSLLFLLDLEGKWEVEGGGRINGYLKEVRGWVSGLLGC